MYYEVLCTSSDEKYNYCYSNLQLLALSQDLGFYLLTQLAMSVPPVFHLTFSVMKSRKKRKVYTKTFTFIVFSVWRNSNY